MNWTARAEGYPEVTESNGLSDIVFIWIKDGQPRRDHKQGFPSVGYYNKNTEHWIDGSGSITSRGWVITHWMKIEPPGA